MGRGSSRQNKTIYQISRENAGFTLASAAEALEFISDSRLDKIEGGRSLPHPEEILRMAEVYKAPMLANYFCSHECPIGMKHVPEVKEQQLSQIVLEMLASLNALNRQQERLIEITSDGEIEEDELSDFVAIQKELSEISVSVASLKLWVEKTIADGRIDREKLEEINLENRD